MYVVVPAGIDDPRSPSGGNRYDRSVCAAFDRPVREAAVAGCWPDPDRAALDRLDAVLAAVPDGASVLLDGLVACAAPRILARHAGRVRAVVLVHLPLGDEHGLAPAVAADRRARERATLHAAAAVVTTSEWTARRVIRLHQLPAARVHVASPGVDAAPIASAHPAGTRLLAVGALTPTKGHDVLVEALARVADRDWTLRLAGPLDRDPAHTAAVRAAADRHGLTDRITLTGPLTGPVLDAAYASADLLVLPSRTETYGMVVTEALTRAVPVVACDVGGVPEALGGGGLLVAPADPDALAGAIRAWLTDPTLRADLRAAARGRRDRLDGWADTARALGAVLP
ncbi:glycosyltransferase family 4 protein [Pseudonocardia sp. HH130629-09]|uniref:glycosyltransferase family 4 protein n=1 Tax=Pseudonocardia sp. HH130629-09 TaxID=1641402 RepID=UPI0006CB0258|nr:glycosyltransferase family 4 protein [Pseudonocardia sp. HH130629-09]ALE85395.1 glycosyl transferase [Pseudonocardia sp. HH130629-09]